MELDQSWICAFRRCGAEGRVLEAELIEDGLQDPWRGWSLLPRGLCRRNFSAAFMCKLHRYYSEGRILIPFHLLDFPWVDSLMALTMEARGYNAGNSGPS